MGQPQFGHKYPRSRYAQLDPLSVLYQTKDEDWLLIAEPKWNQNIQHYLKLLGLEEYSNDERFTTREGAQKNVAEIIGIFEKAFKNVSTKDALAMLKSIDTVHEKLSNPAELYQDPQAWENGYLREMEFANGDKLVLPNSPVHFASIEEPEFHNAPYLGADSDSILRDLGYSPDEIESLHQDAAVVQRSPMYKSAASAKVSK
jgi:crotonobetainyl-CoA:carnitine CoA-transferase CaiB-like acyl-CoA transferase